MLRDKKAQTLFIYRFNDFIPNEIIVTIDAVKTAISNSRNQPYSGKNIKREKRAPTKEAKISRIVFVLILKIYEVSDKIK